MTETLSLGLTLLPEQNTDELLVPWQVAALVRVVGPEPGLLCDALAVPDLLSGPTPRHPERPVAAHGRRRDRGETACWPGRGD